MVRFLIHGYGQFDRRHPLHPVIWPHFDILFVHSGQLSLQWGEENRILLKANEGVLIFPHTPFQGEAVTSPVRASVQHFAVDYRDEGTADPVFADLEGRNGEAWSFSAREHPCLLHDIERALSLAVKPVSPGTKALRLAQLQLIISEISAGRSHSRRKNAAIPPSLDEAIDWAVNHPAEASLAVLAKRSGYSFSHFRALFEKHIGSSPGRYFRRLKINEAKRLLRETRLPLKRIAADLGFADPVSFHRSFVSTSEMTPALYRKRFAPRG